MAENKNKQDELENPWDKLNSNDSDAAEEKKKEEEDEDSFGGAFAQFKKTPTFKIIFVLFIVGILALIGWGIYALSTMEFSAEKIDANSFSDYYENNSSDFWSYVQIFIFGFVMCIFAVRDQVTFKKGQHLDSKSIIVSLGVLGTFLGIFLGLLEFDVSDITGSVPKLLGGLKLAFATSILGMVFSLPITAIQQMPNVDSKSEMRVLMEMNDRLAHATHLEGMAKDSKIMAEAISDMRDNIKNDLIDENSNRTNEILGQIAARSAKTIDVMESMQSSMAELATINRDLLEVLGKSGGANNKNNNASGNVPSFYE